MVQTSASVSLFLLIQSIVLICSACVTVGSMQTQRSSRSETFESKDHQLRTLTWHVHIFAQILVVGDGDNGDTLLVHMPVARVVVCLGAPAAAVHRDASPPLGSRGLSAAERCPGCVFLFCHGAAACCVVLGAVGSRCALGASCCCRLV